MLSKPHVVRLSRQSKSHLIVLVFNLNCPFIFFFNDVRLFIRAKDISSVNKGAILLIHFSSELLVHCVSVQFHDRILLKFLIIVVTPEGMAESMKFLLKTLNFDPLVVVQFLIKVDFLLFQFTIDFESLHFS